MKQYVFDFLRRGLIACGFGPMVLVVFYLILQNKCGICTLNVSEVCVGIGSLSALAFIAGGMNVVYQMERLPLMVAILIHGGVLYTAYLATYLVNGWLEWGVTPILAFSGIFVLGYLVIWVIIYAKIRQNTAKINEQIREKQQNGQN